MISYGEFVKSIGIGMVGSGFMGRCHTNAYSSVAGIFDVPLQTRIEDSG